jgi:hypothetical protein
MKLWELSHYTKQHPTASTRNSLNNVNKLGCAQLHMRFVVVINQQLEISMVTINNNQSGTLTIAQVEKRVPPPGERRNKTPIYVSGVRNTRKFLEWIRAKTASKLLAQVKGEILMLVPETADGFRATTGALRSLGEGKGVSFHTFSLPEDRCVRLLLKNLGKRMPEAEIKEVLEVLHVSVHAVMQLRSNRRDQDPEKDRPLTPHFIVSVARGPEVAKVRSLAELYGLRVQVETYIAPKGPLQCKRCKRFGHTQRNCGYAPRCVACGHAHRSGTYATSKQQLKCYSCGGNHTANYRGCRKWKEARAAAAKRAQGEHGQKDGVSTRLPTPKSTPASLPPEQEKLGPGWNHVVRGGSVVKAKATKEPTLNPSGAGGQTRGRAAPAVGQSKPSRPGTPVVLPQPPQPKHTDSSPPQPQSQSPLEGITDLLDTFPPRPAYS